MSKDHTAIDDAIAALGITYNAEFVPFSRSRDANPKAHPSIMQLNWSVTLTRSGRRLTTDYSQGIAHIPGYKPSVWNTDFTAWVRDACETGKVRRDPFAPSYGYATSIPAPALRDVLYALVSDASVLDYPSFEEWASEFGYDTDSRKAEQTYRACMEIALQLRAMLGDKALTELRDLFSGY